jgi:hypothetical protein
MSAKDRAVLLHWLADLIDQHAAMLAEIAACFTLGERPRSRGWTFRCKPLIRNDRILAQLEKFP